MSERPARERAGPAGGRSAPTPRALLIGLALVVLITGMAQTLSIRHSAAEVAGNAPPPAPTYLLFAYVVLLGPLLLRLHPRLALTRGELLLIYMMMLVAGPIAHRIGIGFLVPHAAAPAYYGAREPRWEQFLPALPGWLSPRDPEVALGFFRGGEPVPWGAWLAPMAGWSSLLIALFFTMLSINVLMRRQWVESERLTFPLTALPLGLTEPGAPLLRKPLFWLGLAVPLLLQAPTALGRYFPNVPSLPLREVMLLDAGRDLAPPWNGLGEVQFSLVFWLVGVVYLIPTEIGFSAWFFHLLAVAQNVVAVRAGWSGETPNVYSNDFPALYAQGAGAALALVGVSLYAARRHLTRVVRTALGRPSGLDDANEFLSYRTALIGAVFGIAFLLGWCWLAGMQLWVAALLFSIVLGYFFIFARIRAETGLGMGVVLWPKMADEMVLTIVGARALTLSDLTILFALRWLYFTPAIGAVMATQLESFKLADAGGLRGRGVGWTLALVAAGTVLLAFVWTLSTYYRHGFEYLAIGQRGTSMVASQSYWSYHHIVTNYEAPRGADWGGLAAMGAGAAVALALSAMRQRFLAFPLHPIGYVAANAWGMHLSWASFLIGWLLKALVTHYGGLALYRRLLPLFLGLIVGEMLHQGVWGLTAWATGVRA